MIPKSVIVDASVAIKWLVNEPDSDVASQLLFDQQLFAPDLLTIEVANALWSMVRRKFVVVDIAASAMTAFSEADIEFRSLMGLPASALRLALELAHPVYDCIYLALALDIGHPVITADKRFYAAVSKHAQYSGMVLLLPADLD